MVVYSTLLMSDLGWCQRTLVSSLLGIRVTLQELQITLHIAMRQARGQVM